MIVICGMLVFVCAAGLLTDPADLKSMLAESGAEEEDYSTDRDSSTEDSADYPGDELEDLLVSVNINCWKRFRRNYRARCQVLKKLNQEYWGSISANRILQVACKNVLKVLEQMNVLIKSGGWLYFDMRNWDKILQEKKRFYLYEPVFLDDVRVNAIQLWDYNADDSMTFHLLYTFEKGNKFFQKEEFEEHYIPIKREIILKNLLRWTFWILN